MNPAIATRAWAAVLPGAGPRGEASGCAPIPWIGSKSPGLLSSPIPGYLNHLGAGVRSVALAVGLTGVAFGQSPAAAVGPLLGAGQGGSAAVAGARLREHRPPEQNDTTPVLWTGAPPMDPNEDWEWEAKQIDALDGVGQLVPVRGFDPSRPPVILVGGLHPNHQPLSTVAGKLSQKESPHEDAPTPGKQVFYFVYDRNHSLPEIGRDLAATIARLREQYYAPGAGLDIVTHSMGGLVTWAALKSLDDSEWLGVGPGRQSNPRGGFGRVRVRSFDAPGAGIPEDWKGAVLRVMLPLASMVPGIGPAEAVWSLFADSAFMERLFDGPLSQISFKNHGAAAKIDFNEYFYPKLAADIANVFWNGILAPIAERDPAELRLLAKSLLTGVAPDEPHLRNLTRFLASDDRAGALVAHLKKAVARDPDLDLAQAMKEAFLETMPPLAGDHMAGVNNINGVADLMTDSLDQPEASAPVVIKGGVSNERGANRSRKCLRPKHRIGGHPAHRLRGRGCR